MLLPSIPCGTGLDIISFDPAHLGTYISVTNVLQPASPGYPQGKQQVSLVTVLVPSSRNVASVRPSGFLGMESGREETGRRSTVAPEVSMARQRQSQEG